MNIFGSCCQNLPNVRQECEAICRQAGAVKRSADQRVGDIKTRKELQCFGAAVIYGE